MTLRVVLVDDQPLVRAALDMVIADAEDVTVVGQAGDGAEAVRLAGELVPDVVVMDIRMPGMDGIEATRLITEGGGPTRVVVLTTFDEDEYVYGALHAGASGFLVKDMALDDILAAVRIVATGDALIAPGVTRQLIKAFTARPPAAGAHGTTASQGTPGSHGTTASHGTAGPHGSTTSHGTAGVRGTAGAHGTAPARETAPYGTASRLGGITGREREVLTLVGRGLSNSEIAEELSISVATAKTYMTRLLTKLDARDRVQLVILAYETGLVAP